jgi:hypothetical protein
MAYQLPWLLMSVATFLVPNSQIAMSNPTDTALKVSSYSCQLGYETKKVSLHYGEYSQGLPCQVSLQQGNQATTLLLEAKRNPNTCEDKAKDMTSRLLDRGWRCNSTGI